MAATARGVITGALPWVAVVILAVFAFTQLRARRDVQGRLVRLQDEVRAEAAMARATGALHDALARGPAGPEDTSVRTLREALAEARRDAGDARAALEAGRRDLDRERARGETLEALRVTQSARADALADEVAALEAAAREPPPSGNEAAEERGADAPAPAPGGDTLPASSVRRWLADAASGDPVRVRYARACVREATPEQVAAMRAVVAADPGQVRPAARIAGSLPESDGVPALLADLVLASPPAERPAVLAELGRESLDRHAPQVLLRLLAAGREDALEVVLLELAPRAGAWAEDDRKALRDGLLGLLRAPQTARLAAGARAFGLLGLDGGAERLAALLGHASAAVRASAAHALSRVGDLDLVRVRVRGPLPGLLADEDRTVRTAGLLLAEAVLGERLEFDPAAPAADRARALERLRARLTD